MDSNMFNEIVNNRIDKIKSVLSSKASEYASEDRLYNFKVAAQINGCTPKRALWGMASKHLVSVMDLVIDRVQSSEYLINEKVGDMINYLILLEALLMEELVNK